MKEPKSRPHWYENPQKEFLIRLQAEHPEHDVKMPHWYENPLAQFILGTGGGAVWLILLARGGETIAVIMGLIALVVFFGFVPLAEWLNNRH